MRACPFCAELKVRLSSDEERPVECFGCGAKGPTPNAPHDTAAELWNARPSDLLRWIVSILAGVVSGVVLVLAQGGAG